MIAPIDEDGRFYAGFGAARGALDDEAEEPVVDVAARPRPARRGRAGSRTATRSAGAAARRSSSASSTTGSSASTRSAQTLLEENATVEWTPPQYRKRMDDWLRNMGDWNISRKRYFGLPLPFYPCACGTLNVIGSRAELEERAVRGLEQLQELHRPWIDEVPIRVRVVRRRGASGSPRSATPGSTPASSRSRRSAGRTRRAIEHGYATGAAEGLTGADLPDHAYWEQWFPADWVSEMREQIRLWFYSQFFMSVTLVGRSPYRRVLTYEKLLDETRPRDAPLVGERDRRERGVRPDGRGRHALAVLRHAAGAEPEVRLRPGERGASGGCSRSGTRSRSSSPTRTSRASAPTYADLDEGPPAGQALDALARRPHAGSSSPRRRTRYERYWTPAVTRAFEAFVDDLSNWYIRRSRRRFYGDDEAAFRTLWYALVQGAARDRAGDAVPRRRALAEPGRGRLRRARPTPSTSPAGPRTAEPDRDAPGRDRRGARGRRARAAGAGGGERQAAPAAAPRVRCAAPEAIREHLDEIAEELRVHEVELLDGAPRALLATSRTCACSARGSGPALPGAQGGARARASSRSSTAGRVRAAGHELGPRRAARRAGEGARLGALRPLLGAARPRARRRARASRGGCST